MSVFQGVSIKQLEISNCQYVTGDLSTFANPTVKQLNFASCYEMTGDPKVLHGLLNVTAVDFSKCASISGTIPPIMFALLLEGKVRRVARCARRSY